MKMREMKKRLALLLSVAMVFWMMPSSAFTALAEWTGTWGQAGPWLKDVKMEPTEKTIQIGETTTITVSANPELASPADAQEVATPSNVSDVLAKLETSDVEQESSDNGEVEIVSVNQGTITVKGKTAGTVTLTLKGIESVSCTVTVSDSDQKAVEAAKKAIQEQSYIFEQETVNDQNTLKTKLEEKINSLPGVMSQTLDEVEVTVSSNFKAATQGTADDIDGEPGNFTFQVKLTKGCSNDTLEGILGTITAKKHDGDSNAQLAVNAIQAHGPYTVEQAAIQDEQGTIQEGKLKDALVTEINTVLGQGSTGATVNSEDITITQSVENLVPGSPDNKRGTNGSFTFTVKVTKGKETATTDPLDGIVEATAYTGDSNAEIAKKAIDAQKTFTVTQENAETNLEEAVAEEINKLLGRGQTGAEVQAKDITITQPDTDLVSGDADDKDGTDGSFKFTVTVTKGQETATTDTLDGIIKATEYPGDSNAEIAKQEIDAQKTFTVTQESAETNLEEAVAEEINKLLDQGQTKANVTAGDITVAQPVAKAVKGDADDKDGTDGSFTFTVKVTKGEEEATTGTLDGVIKATVYPDDSNAEIAKQEIEAQKSFTVTQENAEKGLEEAVAEEINKLLTEGGTGATVSAEDITVVKPITKEAVKGDADDKDGTDGSFTFTVKVTKGQETATTGNLDGIIKATEYPGDSNADLAKAAIEGGEYIFTQAEAESKEALSAALVGKINELLKTKELPVEVTAENITIDKFDPAVAGTVDIPDGKGTDGKFTFTVNISKGAHTAKAENVSGAITATPFDGLTNAQAVADAKTIIDGGTYTFTQAKAGTVEDLKAALAAGINAMSGMSETGITVTAENISVDPFTPAGAGTADNLKGVNGSFTFTVNLVKGSAAQTAGKTGAITADAFIVTGFTFDSSRVTIDLTQAVEAEITVTPVLSGTPSAEQKEAIYQDFLDGKFTAATTFTGKDCARVLKTTVNEDLTVTLTIEGLAIDSATLRVSYGVLTAACPVVVTETGSGPVVGADVPKVTLSDVNTEELAGNLNNIVEEGTSVPENAPEQIEQIIEVLSTTEPPFEENNLSVENVLLEELPEAQVIILTPFVEIQDLNLAVEGDTVVVKSMKTELKVEIDVDGEPLQEEEVKALLQKNGVYISMSVAVPGRDARGGADYVEWTHYDGERVDNSVIQDTVTRISDDNIATVKSKSFSPFDLTFVANDNESHIPSDSGDSSDSSDDSDDSCDSSDSDSSSAQPAAVGQWKKAADGVRWWYENPDGTWPADGWAQLVWNDKIDWYYFDAEGYMVTGWVTWEDNRYYLHPISDNTQGHMYTGWQVIEGKWYYFRPESGGPQGSLLVNGITPDGCKVDADGVWIQ